MPNRLASERSPYLLQHKDNPVDWWPWHEDAFATARREDKPIFLSIGYSTCHWCHVMEHESFEDAGVAAVLNRYFVSIKVDREERPDVDRVYMTFVQAMTGAGGWPMSVWLTPGLEPFYGGTYFPPAARWGKPGFVSILEEIARAWREERQRVVQSAASIMEQLQQVRVIQGSPDVPEPEVLEAAVDQFWRAFDHVRGGFGDAPKFPRPSELLFLLREYARRGVPEARDMVLDTLRAMSLGGIHDHLGGGFHRYAVDGSWRVPHFEKMLYDQAQMVLALLEAAQVAGDGFFADVAASTLAYVERDLTAAEGGFLSAEDADSLAPEHASDPAPHKTEGAFYTWRDDEIGAVLAEDADLFRLRFGILPDGNAPFDPQQEFAGKNLLYAARSVGEVATLVGRPRDEVEATLERARTALLEVRGRRPRPHLDDKVITAWNGLMIAGFARAARGLPDGARRLRAAQRAATFLRTHLWDDESSRLRRRYRAGEAGIDGYAEDYACLIHGLIELFQADGDPAWLEWALVLQRRQDELFWDEQDGGWFSTSGEDQSVLLRLKETYDGAEPAAGSVAVHNLLMLSHLTADAAMTDKMTRAFQMFGTLAERSGRTIPMLLAALSVYHAGVRQLVVAGSAAAVDGFRRSIGNTYRPDLLVIPLTDEHRHAMARVLPWTAAMGPVGGRTTGYLCQNFTCDAPETEPEAIRARLLAGLLPHR